jgi:hypothetical protein
VITITTTDIAPVIQWKIVDVVNAFAPIIGKSHFPN